MTEESIAQENIAQEKLTQENIAIAKEKLTSAEDTLSKHPNSYVIICAWPPTNNKKIIPLGEAVFRRQFGALNLYARIFGDSSHAHIGHASMFISDGDRMEYVSFFPTKASIFKSTFAINHSLRSDFRDHESMTPKQIILFNLDTKAMLKEFDLMKKEAEESKLEWFLSGIKLFNPQHKKIYNCSSFVEKLLKVGGIYPGLVPYNKRLHKPMTPMDVYRLGEHASKAERKLYPATEATLQEYWQAFSEEMLQRSKDKIDPFEAVNDYLSQHPDLYLRVNQYNPKALTDILTTVSKNIQTNQSKKLLDMVVAFNPNETSSFSLRQFEKLLSREANISHYDQQGYNALHLMVKHNFLPAIKLIVEKTPQALNYETKNVSNNEDDEFVSKTALDIATEVGNVEVIDLLKKNGGLTRECKETLNTSARNMQRIFKSNDELSKVLEEDQEEILSSVPQCN